MARREDKKMFTDIGVVGRRTGLTVGADLVMDDDGMENMSAFFSPAKARAPETSPLAEIHNVTSHTIVPSPRGDSMALAEGSEDDTTMDIDENSGRAPKEVLASRRKEVNSPVPRAASTNKSSPFAVRRGSRQARDSSPFSNGRQGAQNASPDSHPDDNGDQDSDGNTQPAIIENLRSSPSPVIPDADVDTTDNRIQPTAIERSTINSSSPAKDNPLPKPPARNKKAPRGKLLTSSKRLQPVETIASEEFVESNLPPLEGIASAREQNPKGRKKRKSEENLEDTVSMTSKRGQAIPPASRKRSRKNPSPMENIQNESDTQLASASPASPAPPTASSSAGRRKRLEDKQATTNTKSATPKKPKQRGRPARANKGTDKQQPKKDMPEEIEVELDHVSHSPAPFQGIDEPATVDMQIKSKSQTSRGASRKNEQKTDSSSTRQPPIEVADDGNHNSAKPKRGRKRKERMPEEELVKSVIEKESEAPIARGSETQRQKTSIVTMPVTADASDDADGKRRSQRSRIQPLQFWKNERTVYTVEEPRNPDSAPSVVRQVVRMGDTPPKAKRVTRKYNPPQRAKAGTHQKSEEPELPEDEEWEQTGRIAGMVKVYSRDGDASMAEEEEYEEIAVSRHKMVPKAVYGAEYKFYKTLGKEFMGAGIIEMQPGSSKKTKTSGRMQLVFYVVSGKVEAVVNNLGFRIGTGSQFQVPRGNMYQISNPFEKTAKIFFAQACIPDHYQIV